MLTHDEYTKLVDSGTWPEDRLVPLDAPFLNPAGSIQNVLLRPCTSVAVIRSLAQTLRANHYHRSDWHYSYVLSGEVLYFERPVGAQGVPPPLIFRAGEMFFTPPMVEHCMAFREDTVFMTMAKNVRSHDSHESDLVRVAFVHPSHLGW